MPRWPCITAQVLALSLSHAGFLLLAVMSVASVAGFTPYTPTPGWRYALEAAGRELWPACPDRFVTFPLSCAPPITLGATVGTATSIELVPVPSGSIFYSHQPETRGASSSGSDDGGTFYIKLGCGRYLSVAGPCDQLQVDDWPEAGINQAFRFAPLPDGGGPSHDETLRDPAAGAAAGTNVSFGWSLEAVGRAECANRFVNFPPTCGDGTARLTMAVTPGLIRLQVLGSINPLSKAPSSSQGCADPFAWWARKAGSYYLTCTGGNLGLYSIRDHGAINATAQFVLAGEALGGHPSAWAASGNRWAPENLEVSGGSNVIFVADDDNGKAPHRVGWVMSHKDVAPGSWDSYSPTALNLGGARGGEIDAHVFRDTDGKTYLLWKTDDNSIGATTTRLWGQELAVTPTTVSLVGSRKQLLDSTGM